MARRSPAEELVGVAPHLDRLGDLLNRALDGQRVTVLVSGEAGIGKTSLVRAITDAAVERGGLTTWGTCFDAGGAPGHWPWSQFLNGLVRAVGVDRPRLVAGDDAPLLATICGLPFCEAAAQGEARVRSEALL